MIDFVIKRLLLALPVMAVVSFVVFSLLLLSPTNPAAVIAGDYATPQAIAEIRAKMGFDQPLIVQYGKWAQQLLHGNLGVSVYENRPVIDMIAERAEPTVSLAICVVLVTLFAVPLGVISSWWAGRPIDRLVMAFAAIGTATPIFLFAYLLIGLFSTKLKLFPTYGFTSITAGVGPFLSHIALPTLTAGIAYGALVARVSRSSMLEVLNQDYMRTAKAKGLSVHKMIFRHALPNCAIPIVTVIGTRFAALLGGIVVTETVFAIPGIGRLCVDAILHGDYPVVQGVIIVVSLVYILVNLAMDLIYPLIDPRVRAS
ncbi:MAG: ABC transporter permease [Betaproteobacteria bacterium]|nr:ABC transporter permease [Betaproteobacteria bacterium]